MSNLDSNDIADDLNSISEDQSVSESIQDATINSNTETDIITDSKIEFESDVTTLTRNVIRQAIAGPPLSPKLSQWISSPSSQWIVPSPLASYPLISLSTEFANEHMKIAEKLVKPLQSDIIYPLYVHNSLHSLFIFDLDTMQCVQNLTLPLKIFLGVKLLRFRGLVSDIRKQFIHACTIEESLTKKVQGTSFTVWDIRSGVFISHEKLKYVKGKNLFNMFTWEDNYFVFVSTKGEMEVWKMGQVPVEGATNQKSPKLVWKLDFCWYWNFSKEIPTVSSVSFSPFKKNLVSITSPTHAYFVGDFNPYRPPQILDNWFKVTQTKIQQMIWSPNQESQLFLVTSREISLYDMELRKNILGKSIRCPNGRSDFQSIYFHEDVGQFFFTYHVDGMISAWTYNTEKNLYLPNFSDLIRGPKHGIDRSSALISVSFSPKTRNVIAYDCDGTRWFWKFDTLREKSRWILRGYFESISSQISSLQVSLDSFSVAIGTISGDLYIYSLEDGILLNKFKIFDGPVQNITWTSDFSIVCSCNSPGNKSGLVSLSLYTGETLQLKSGSDVSSDPIVTLRISNSKKFLIVIQKVKPLELWNLKDFEVVCFIPIPVSSLKTFEWCHPSDVIYSRLQDSSSEIFYISYGSNQQGNFLTYYLINDSTKEVTKFKDVQYPITLHLLEKNKIRISGDSNGNILIWNRGNSKENIPVQYQSHKGSISKIQFSHQGPYAFILYTDGFIEVWDLDSRKILSKASALRLQIVACDWTHNNLLVCGRIDGSILVFDLLLKRTHDSITKRRLRDPLQNPILLNDRESLALRVLLEENKLFSNEISQINLNRDTKILNQTYTNGYGEKIPIENPYVLEEKNDYEEWLKTVYRHKALIPSQVKNLIESSINLSEKYLYIAQYFSEDATIRFWQLAQVNLKQLKNNNVVQILSSQVDMMSSSESEEYIEKPKPVYSKNLSSSLGVYRDKESIQKDEQTRLWDHDHTVRLLPNGEGVPLYQQVAQELALFGSKDDTVNLLLQTPHDHEDVYINYFHACLCAASNSQAHFRQTVLFVTSNLIAKRNHPGNFGDRKKDLSYATELLCLIGESHRACRILQNSDLWEKAAQIAQTLCKEEERLDILVRWAIHLTRTDDKFRACLVWLNLGYLYNVLEVLLNLRMDSTAVSLLKVIEAENLPIIRCNRKGIGILSEKILDNTKQVSEKVESEDLLLKQLKCRIYWTYARTLKTCRLFELATNYESIITPEDVQLSRENLYP